MPREGSAAPMADDKKAVSGGASKSANVVAETPAVEPPKQAASPSPPAEAKASGKSSMDKASADKLLSRSAARQRRLRPSPGKDAYRAVPPGRHGVAGVRHALEVHRHRNPIRAKGGSLISDVTSRAAGRRARAVRSPQPAADAGWLDSDDRSPRGSAGTLTLRRSGWQKAAVRRSTMLRATSAIPHSPMSMRRWPIPVSCTSWSILMPHDTSGRHGAAADPRRHEAAGFRRTAAGNRSTASWFIRTPTTSRPRSAPTR